MDFQLITLIVETILIIVLVILGMRDVNAKELENTPTPLVETPSKPIPIETTEPSDEPFDDDVYYVRVNEDDAKLMAQCAWGEFNDTSNPEQIAAVMWVILNRVDANYDGQHTIEQVIKAPGQFNGYSRYAPIVGKHLEIAKDVLYRHELEMHYGIMEEVSGRVLPSNYLFFSGNGYVNTFRTDYVGGTEWDFSWWNPYEE